MRKRLYLFIFICWLAGIFTLMLTPLPPPLEPIRKITYYDKVAHLIFFGVLTYLMMAIGLKLRRFRLWTIGLTATSIAVSLALLAEHLQGFIPGREPSFLDLLAGTIGMALAWPVAIAFHYRPKRKLLLHVCCAPCATAVKEVLEKGYDIEFFFFNPNIHPKKENEKRFKEVKKLAKRFGIKLRKKEGDHKDWLLAVAGHENDEEGGERCEKCFLYRLRETASFSKNLGLSIFTTTLSISPHKNTEKINQSGREAGELSGLEFLEADFKQNNGFARSVELSKKMGLYRQKYCGCEFSIKRKPKI
jgi:epoxyqueuosine reductase